MKTIKPTKNEHQWPRKAVSSVECRKRDLVVRITDWTRDKDEPAFDVEIYVGGVYDFNLSAVFSTKDGKEAARQAAISFAAQQIGGLL